MNRYKAFYRSKKVEVEAETTYAAQRLAAELFKAKKPWEVAILLVEVDGRDVEEENLRLL